MAPRSATPDGPVAEAADGADTAPFRDQVATVIVREVAVPPALPPPEPPVPRWRRAAGHAGFAAITAPHSILFAVAWAVAAGVTLLRAAVDRDHARVTRDRGEPIVITIWQGPRPHCDWIERLVRAVAA